MAEEKSYKPTKRKLERAIREGRLLCSSELTQAIALGVGIITIFFVFKRCWVSIRRVLNYTFSEGVLHPETVAKLWAFECFSLISQVLLGISLTAVLSQLLLRGFVVRFSWLSFKPSRLSVLEGAKRILSGLGSFGWTLVKFSFCLVLFVIVIWCLFASLTLQIVSLSLLPIQSLLQLLGLAVWVLLGSGVLGLILCGCLDFFLKRRQYLNQLSMNRSELCREQREEDGDPMIKAYRKNMQRAWIMQELKSRVRRSKVILVSTRSK